MADTTSKFQYRCDKCNSEIYSEKEQKKCLVIWLGSPCKGKLVRFGPGSRTEAK